MRIRMLIAISLAFLIALAASVADAARRRSADREGRELRAMLAAQVGWADLALSSHARWLRHPSLAEPGAAFSDIPGGFDVDPAGAFIAPPREVLVNGDRILVCN